MSENNTNPPAVDARFRPVREIPAPVRLAREALEILRGEDAAKAEASAKALPSFALQLEKSGVEVTVDILLTRARAGDLDFKRTLQKKSRSYAEIVAPLRKSAENKNVEEPWEAAKTGDLEKLKQLIAQGADVHAHNEEALQQAAGSGHLDIVKYLVEQCGSDVHVVCDAVLHWAAFFGHLHVVKYLVEERGANNGVALLSAAGNGHLEVVKYLLEHDGTVIGRCLRHAVVFGHDAGRHDERDGLLTMAVSHAHIDVAQYLIGCGARRSALDSDGKKALKTFLKILPLWQKAAHVAPPSGLHEENPRFFMPQAFAAVRDFIGQEGYTGPEANQFAFHAAGLFGTEDRVLQYLEQWGKPGEQPLHDIIYQIKLPSMLCHSEAKPKKLSVDGTGEILRCAQDDKEMDLKAWGDAVLKCGPSMAALVKFADRLPAPEKSADGKTWSMVKTREKVAQFVYKRGAENRELASLCLEHAVDEGDFNTALALVKKAPKTKNIPEISIDGKKFDMEGAKFYRLPSNDVRGLFLGELTDCCQSIGGHGNDCAEHGFTSKDGGFYVVENARGKIIGQAWAWRGEQGELTFDSLETLGKNIKPEQWIKILKATGKELTKKKNDVTRLTVGLGGGTPASLIASFNNTVPVTPKNYGGYRDSRRQAAVWERFDKSR